MSSTSSSSRSASPVAAAAENVKHEEAPVAGHSKVESGSDMQDGIDRLLQRHRNELMYELRSLQHGQRPVTGQDNKQQVEDFFNRAVQQSSGDVLPPGNEPPRPESVLVEVNALVQRRPVSSILQSASFRQSLENAVRGAISRVSTSGPARTTQASTAVSGAGALAGVNSNLVNSTSSQPQASAERPRTPQVTPRQSRHPVPRPRAHQSPSPVTQHTEHPAIPQAPPLPQEARAQAWLQQQPLHQFAGELAQQSAVWESLEQSQRESMVMEISELVQQHLVSSSLESGFRNRLEGLMRDRVVQTGTEGGRVQQFIQSLPRSFPHQRNDFSELGIVPPAQQDNLSDDVSVISAAAAVTVHNSQANAAMSREMNSLKVQLAELKNMMRMNFDLQLDIQRAIRQEVAAAVAGALQQPGASPSTSAPARTPRPVAEGHCLICLDGSVDSVLYQCGHMCVCHTCGLQLKARGAHCPMCRAPIRDIIRAYKTQE